MASVLDQAHFRSEVAAYRWVEARVWPNGRVCPHCGTVENSVALKGKSTRIGVYKCRDCRKPFTVKVGTIFESSHIKLHLWLQAMFLIASSKKGISSNQLHRTLGITLKSAWFMSHRIRLAMKETGGGMFGAGGGGVEADETFIGQAYGESRRPAGYGHKQKMLTLIDREQGKARSFVIGGEIRLDKIKPILEANIAKDARVMTDEARHYYNLKKIWPSHQAVNHGKGEYVSREDRTLHTNTVEGYYSVFKRGMRGIYQHCAEHHLHRYAAEFDFRYSNRVKLGVDDQERFSRIVEGVVGKRFTYQTTASEQETAH
ncbi:MAG: IS1595 family transposase [Terricaulis sp.]